MARIAQLTTHQVTIRKNYRRKITYSKVWLSMSSSEKGKYEKGDMLYNEIRRDREPGKYVIYYDTSGTVRAHGLEEGYSKIGFWRFYDEKGILIKTADYENWESRTHNGYEDRYDSLLKRMEKAADSAMIAKFGKQFFEQNFKKQSRYYDCSPGSYEYGHTTKQWLDVQDLEPNQFSFSYNLSYQDSFPVKLIHFSLKPDGTMGWFDEDKYPDCNQSPELCEVKISAKEAIKIARSEQFDYISGPELELQTDGFYWRFKAEPVYDKGSRHNGNESWFLVNARTGFFYSGGGYFWCDHCDPVVYTKSYEDTLLPPKGYKAQYLDNLLLNVPEDWVELHEYERSQKYSNDYTYFNQEDTLLFTTNSGYYVTYVLEKDVPTISPSQKKRIDSYNRAFYEAFPDSTIIGRLFELSMTVPEGRKKGDLELVVHDDHGGFGVGRTNYYIKAQNLTEEQFDRIFQILKSARFLSYR